MRRGCYERVGRYLVYLFGEVYPVHLKAHVDEVRLQFIRGWDAAKEADRELDNIAIQVLANKALDRRRGGCF